MSRLNRIYKIHDILRNATRPVPMRRIQQELEATRNTVTRKIGSSHSNAHEIDA